MNKDDTVCNVESLADILQRVQENPSRIDYQNWYTEVYNYGWGPEAKRFPIYKPSQACLKSLNESDRKLSVYLGSQSHAQIVKRKELVKVLRARLVATSKLYVGLNYQHHHLPTWNPQLLPQQLVDQYLAQASTGPQYIDDTGELIERRQFASPGIDCSNFTAWVYNIALGVKFTSGIEEQAGNMESAIAAQANPKTQQQQSALTRLIDSWTLLNASSSPSVNTDMNAASSLFVQSEIAPGRVLNSAELYEPGDLIFLWPKSSVNDPSRRTRIEHVLMYIGNGQVINSSTNQPEGVKIEPLSTFKNRIAWARRIVE